MQRIVKELEEAIIMHRLILLVDDGEDSKTAEKLLKRERVHHHVVNRKSTRHVAYTHFPVFFTLQKTFVGLRNITHAINTHRYL